MSLIIATGSNLGDSINNLQQAKETLQKYFTIIAESSIFVSDAVDYEDQPKFYNQVLEFEIPNESPDDTMKKILEIEAELGRVRSVKYGPRTIDIDIVFWGTEEIRTQTLIAPHPRWNQRSFVVKPLQQLPFFKTIQKCFKIPTTFDVNAIEIKSRKY